MFRGKKYQNSAKQIDRAALYEAKDALTPATLTSRSAAPSSCPTAPARPAGYWCSPRATRLTLPVRPARIS